MGGRRRSPVAAAALAAVLLLSGPGAPRAAVELPEDVPVRFVADEVSYDRDLGLVTARGSVEITQKDRTLFADTVTYNQRLGLMTASGDVTLVEPTGDVIFAQHVELTGDFRDGIIEDLRMILHDRSRVAAAGARRSNYDIDMRNAVYSPCEPCREDPTRPLLWQVKAIKVIHRKEEQLVEYRDAWLEVKGVPVAYVPYLSHPDPTVRRKSGFLPPDFGSSSDLGYTLKVPYFYVISPESDVTVTPTVAHKTGPGLEAEYRSLFQDGKLDLSGSINHDPDDDARGHVFGRGRFDIDDTWRWGFDVQRSTDDTYLRRYRFRHEQTLTSDLFAEGFRKRNYVSASAYAFQGLDQNDDPGLTPLVIPLLDYNHVGEADRFGGHTKLDVNLLSLIRNEGTDTRRLSFRPGWQLPYVAPAGDAYKLSLSLIGDLYQVSRVDRGPQQGRFSGWTGRVVPEAALDWRYPFVAGGERISQVVEPIAAVIVSPYGGNPNKIPNEDSLEVEFDGTNLFSANRFAGLDRVEGGPRVHYGLKWGAYGAGGGRTTVLVGQSYRPKRDDTFPGGSGLEDHLSDIVGRVEVSPGRYVNLDYRTRLNKSNLGAERTEVLMSLGAAALNVSANYSLFNRQQQSQFKTREEASFAVSSQVDRFWRLQFGGVRDLKEDELRNLGLSLAYEDECLVFQTVASRTFYVDRDLRPSDSIVFRVTFKTLGEVQSGISDLF
jgi:LPS-assembly protein